MVMLGIVLNIIFSIIVLIVVSFIFPFLQKEDEKHSIFYGSAFECPVFVIFTTMLTLCLLSLIPYCVVTLTILTSICGISYFYGKKYFGNKNDSSQ